MRALRRNIKGRRDFDVSFPWGSHRNSGSGSGNHGNTGQPSDYRADIERYLRKRTVGSVYQYVFNLGLAEKKDVKVEGLKIEKYRELEMLCYLKGVNDTEYQVSKAISKKYFENNLLEIEIDLSKWNDIEKIR